MSVRVVLPNLQPGWVGGIRYLSTIRTAVGILADKGVVELLEKPRSKIRISGCQNKYGLVNVGTFCTDAMRGFRGLNIPRPLSQLSERSLGWIPDLQEIERPDFFVTKEILRREKLRLNYLKRNRAFVFSSTHALEVFNSIGYRNPLIAGILRFASNISQEDENESFDLPCLGCKENGYFYLPNQWWVHKNHNWALSGFLDYQLTGGNAHLILTGSEIDSRWPDYSAEQVLSKHNVRNVHRLGMVKRATQKQLFLNAIAVLQPSSYEGWSTTIEEALSCGTPIIASRIPSNSEQLVSCSDSLLIQLDSKIDLVAALHTPPTRLSGLDVANRNSFRWNRFIDDLERVILLGNTLIVGAKNE